VHLPSVCRTSGVVVLILESHITPFPVFPEYSSGHFPLTCLQDMTPWSQLSYKSLGRFGDQAISVGVLPSNLGLLMALVEVSLCLGTPTFRGSWMPPVSASLALALVFFNFHLAHPDNAFFTRWSPPTPETRCPRPSPAVGMLELLVACSGMSVLLTLKRGILSFTLGRFLTFG
jgi:hypothetical protein